MDTETIKQQRTSEDQPAVSDRSEFSKNQEEALVAKIRDRFTEIEELIENMKSKLPARTQ